MSKSPAFQFYVKDWLGSTKVNLMTLEEQGAYLRLLCHAWNDQGCALNNNDDELSILSGLGEKWFNGSHDKIKSCFTLKGNKLVHKRLLIERKKQEEFRRKCSDAGRKSAEVRKNKDLQPKVGSTDVATDVQPEPNSSVCSLQSSTSVKEKNKRTVFKKPSLDEVEAYCKERKNSIDPETFIAHYNSNGWKVGGKGAMKDWKSAIITWEKRSKGNSSGDEYVGEGDLGAALKKHVADQEGKE